MENRTAKGKEKKEKKLNYKKCITVMLSKDKGRHHEIKAIGNEQDLLLLLHFGKQMNYIVMSQSWSQKISFKGWDRWPEAEVKNQKVAKQQ